MTNGPVPGLDAPASGSHGDTNRYGDGTLRGTRDGVSRTARVLLW